MKRLFFVFALFLGLSLGLSSSVQAQCAMCRATVSSNVVSKESKVGSGLNTGILYLMTIPYLLIGTVGFIWYRSAQQKKKNALSAGHGQV